MYSAIAGLSALGSGARAHTTHSWYIYICIYVYACIYIYICRYIQTHIYTYMYACVCVCVCIYIYIHTLYIYMSTHARTHTHTHLTYLFQPPGQTPPSRSWKPRKRGARYKAGTGPPPRPRTGKVRTRPPRDGKQRRFRPAVGMQKGVQCQKRPHVEEKETY